MSLDSIGTQSYRYVALPPSVPVTEPLHSGALSTPVPHWVVLLAVVPALWLVIGAAVIAVDRLLQRLGA